MDSKHTVHFYEDDGALCEILADFSREGLENGESVILVATEAHRREVERRLAECGIGVGGPQGFGSVRPARCAADA